ncbi:hypothetical protein JG688_00004755, partial [Phytophthora aleatoria]
LSARAWRTGVPFTLLHDEGFVVEKFQELLATSSAQSAGKQSNTKSAEEAQTTVSGLDEAPMDEMQHATDMARIKLFARTKRDGGTGDLGGSRPTSPSSLGPAAASTLTSSTAKENPPSALAGMVGNTLSRESPESADSERLRAQRDKLLQVYFEQIAVRVRHNQMAAVEETAREGGLQDIEGSLASIMPSGSVEIPLSTELPTTDKRREISQNVTAASVFSVGSLRLQLEMLREFRVLSSKLFENGTMTLVQTLLGSPPFALQDVVAGYPFTAWVKVFMQRMESYRIDYALGTFEDNTTLEKKFMLSDLVMEQRHRILSIVKRTVWDSALGRTNESGVSFELTLNRPKAMRFRATGKTDVEGRHTLFSQAFRQLQALDGTHFRREDALYHVTFLGENAQDAGGPYRETFAQYCEELQSTQLPLMLPTPNSQHNVGVGREKWLLSPGAQSSTTLQMLEFLGKLMGASIRSKQYLALNLAPLVWKKLAGERLVLDDLAAMDSMLVNSMSRMRTIDHYGVTEEMFEDIVMETFTTLGADNQVIELKPGGAHLPVTFSSRCEYADLVEQARLHESDDQAQAIFRGLAKVVPAKLLACFSGAELELMVCGLPEVDVNLLEKCTEYSSCSPTDDHIIWFWRALRDFSHEERSAFLRFVWGRSRLPASADEFPQRFKLQSFNMQRAGRSVDAYMPVAHTCFFSIEIPAYSSESVLREKLLYAIYNCQEIDGDGDSVAANQLGWEE